LYDHESLVKAVKEADVVISTVGARQLADQTRIIAAIKEAGNVKVDHYIFSVLLLSIFIGIAYYISLKQNFFNEYQ